MRGAEPIEVLVDRVQREAAQRNRSLEAWRIRRDWRDAAEQGMTVAEAAAFIGRDVAEGRKLAEKYGFRFRKMPAPSALPRMSPDQRRLYKKMRAAGIPRAASLQTLGLTE